MSSIVGARSRRSGPGHARRVVGVLITAVLGASVAQSTLPADSRAQVPPLDCSGNAIYQLQRASTGSTSGRLNTVAVGSMSGTNPVTATQVSNPIPAGTANALGISDGGLAAWALAPQQPGGTGNTLIFTLYSFDPATEAWTPHTATIDTAGRLPSGVTAANIRSGGIVAGAVDPRSGNFFWAYLANAPTDAMTIFGFNTTTNQPIGVVANSSLPQTLPTSGSTNGDIAFDGAGNLFVVSNTGTHAAVGAIEGPLPTTQHATTPTLANTRLTTFSNTDNNSYNGIAFNGIGELFIQWSSSSTTTTIRKINPQNGASIAGPSTVSHSPTGGGIGVDLGGCATPPTLELRKDVNARKADTDQFHLSISGGTLTQGNTTTTSGTGTGVQEQTAGPVVARAGTTYTFAETAAGTTNLANYGPGEWRCVDQAAGNVEVAAGTGRTFTFAPTAGQAILCTFTNSFPAGPGLDVEKTGVLDTGADGVAGVGDIINYTITVTNTGNVTLRNVRVAEQENLGLAPIDCGGGTNVIATLGPGDSVKCTTTHAVTQADIDVGFVPNFATATGTPPQGPDIEDGDGETVPITARPDLEVDKTGELDTGANGVANVGDTINYTITVRNTGNVTLRNVTVSEQQSLAGISAIDCGGGTDVVATLAPGESVECTASHVVTRADVDAGFVPNFAIATATPTPTPTPPAPGAPPQGSVLEDGDNDVEAIPAVIALRKTATPSVVTRGSTVRFRLQVTNTSGVPARAVRICRQRIADHRGRPLFDFDVDEVWRGVGPSLALHRADLHQVLLAGAKTVPVRWSCSPVSVTDTDEDVRVDFADGSSGRYDLVVGADGVHSTVRRLLFGESASARPVGQYARRFIAEWPDAAPEWSLMAGRGTVFLTIPIGDGKVYCYTDCRPSAARSPLHESLAGYGEPVPRLIRESGAAHVHGAPVEEVRLPRWSRGAVLLIGDAAHATSPNMAEGAAMALEDAIVLADTLAGERTITGALRAYEMRRRVRTDRVLAQTHRRDRSRGLPPVIRNAVLRRTGRRLFAAGYAPLHAQP